MAMIQPSQNEAAFAIVVDVNGQRRQSRRA